MSVSFHPFLLLPVLAGPLQAQSSPASAPAPEPEVRFTQRTTNAELRALQKSRRFGGVAQRDGGETRADRPGHGSDFIIIDGVSTFVPKTAILHLPERLQGAVGPKPEGRILMFQEFLGLNRTRVETFEVSLDEAVGRVPIEPERLASAKLSNRVIVAVHGGNPVSVAASHAPTTNQASE